MGQKPRLQDHGQQGPIQHALACMPCTCDMQALCVCAWGSGLLGCLVHSPSSPSYLPIPSLLPSPPPPSQALPLLLHTPRLHQPRPRPHLIHRHVHYAQRAVVCCLARHDLSGPCLSPRARGHVQSALNASISIPQCTPTIPRHTLHRPYSKFLDKGTRREQGGGDGGAAL